jgi:tRNA-Thr(GGU) m(6)t(6)A37 methyltransferase TsaA
MTRNEAIPKGAFQVYLIGYVKHNESEIALEILELFRGDLKQLDHFSHLFVFWWADRHDNQKSRGIMQTEPPYAQGKVTGVFACRSEYRPNPIALTTCRILAVDEECGFVKLANIDAIDGTPILDLKAYFPVCERVKEAHIPEWLSDWPEWMPDEELGL